MGLRALIVDDEPFARADLRALVQQTDDIEVAWEASSVREARDLLKQAQPDVAFLDVQLAEGCGFDVMPCLPESTQVIFVTAHDQYALRAFEVNALDYLLKPVSTERFLTCLSRLSRRSGAASTPCPRAQVALEDRILVKSGTHREFVKVGELVAVTSMGGNYTQVCKADGSWLDVRRTIKQWEAILPRDPFVRVHRATMVNVQHVESVARPPGGGILLRVKHIPSAIAVSRRHARRLEVAIVNSR